MDHPPDGRGGDSFCPDARAGGLVVAAVAAEPTANATVCGAAPPLSPTPTCNRLARGLQSSEDPARGSVELTPTRLPAWVDADCAIVFSTTDDIICCSTDSFVFAPGSGSGTVLSVFTATPAPRDCDAELPSSSPAATAVFPASCSSAGWRDALGPAAELSGTTRDGRSICFTNSEMSCGSCRCEAAVVFQGSTTSGSLMGCVSESLESPLVSLASFDGASSSVVEEGGSIVCALRPPEAEEFPSSSLGGDDEGGGGSSPSSPACCSSCLFMLPVPSVTSTCVSPDPSTLPPCSP